MFFSDIRLEVFPEQKNRQLCQVSKALMCVIPLIV